MIKRVFLVVFIVITVHEFYGESIDLFGSLEEARDALMEFYDPASKDVKQSTTTVTPTTRPTVAPTTRPRSGGWGSRRRRYSRRRPAPRPAPPPAFILGKPAPASTTPASTTPASTTPASTTPASTRSPSIEPPSKNKFSKALEDIEKALANAQETSSKVTHDLQRLRRLRDLITTAVAGRSFQFARKTIGEAMYTIAKIKETDKAKARRKRETKELARSFLRGIKDCVGGDAFSDLLAMQGQVTLMFAIDTTGSMREEITAAKNIAQTISSLPRSEPVDYILSPFTDPESAFQEVEYFDESQHGQFITSLNNIEATGGGDCPELTFKGMIDAIEVGQPLDDSPMYVFTDAGPKDGNEDNIDHLSEIADDLGVVINFFVVQTNYYDCTSPESLKPFKRISEKTTGQTFLLKDENELEELEGIIANSLGGTTVISTATNTISLRKKRSSGRQTKTYIIPVDDSIETLVISITADHPHGRDWSVTLTTPSGSNVTPQRMDKVIIYQISTPSIGEWKLQIDSANYVKYDYYAKGSSADNIDFEFYFVKKSKKGLFIPVSNPVTGEQAQAIMTLGGVNKVDNTSLQAEFVTLEGEPLITHSSGNTLKSEDTHGIRYLFEFTLPGELFKIKIKGKTKDGNLFERICHEIIKHNSSLLIKVLYGRNDYTVSSGNETRVSVTTENKGNTEPVRITSFGRMASITKITRSNIVIRKNRRTTSTIYFTADASAKIGHTILIVAVAKGEDSGSKSITSVPILVV